ncbi:Homoserine dehydrogenase [Yarrowia sp. E02]|nr:Homoserine dehydrogenase [Yarrowia sp. E02]
MSKAVNIAIIGTGLVGKAFINQLAAVKSSIAYNVVLIARSSKTLISQDFKPLSLTNWESELNSSSVGAMSFTEINDFLKKSPLPVILVDNTSNEALANEYTTFVNSGISIATPNKKAFSSDLKTWEAIFGGAEKSGALVYHEATVGAGLPVISTLNDLIATGDEVETVEGIVSGTLSYIFNEFSTLAGSDVKFSDVVTKAKQLGYTEPDPREDLNGLDVARKVTILARLSGFDVESPTAFPVQSLIPKPLETASSADEFLQKLPEYDADLAKLRDEAFAEKKVLRFVGSINKGTGKVEVGIQKYDASHPFASLKGSDNIIAFKTKRYPNPLVIQGAGAGDAVTAAGVLGDVFKAAQRLAK